MLIKQLISEEGFCGTSELGHQESKTHQRLFWASDLAASPGGAAGWILQSSAICVQPHLESTAIRFGASVASEPLLQSSHWGWGLKVLENVDCFHNLLYVCGKFKRLWVSFLLWDSFLTVRVLDSNICKIFTSQKLNFFECLGMWSHPWVASLKGLHWSIIPRLALDLYKEALILGVEKSRWESRLSYHSMAGCVPLLKLHWRVWVMLWSYFSTKLHWFWHI